MRALETVTDERGLTHPGNGWTTLVIARDRPLRAVTGLITGLHEPRASHLAILEQAAIAAIHAGAERTHGGAESAACQLERAYAEAQERGYLWHEFGDTMLFLP